jgi:AAA domain, putative AbiEii toxin, Type IV TA system/AAA domain/SIR2-like domain
MSAQVIEITLLIGGALAVAGSLLRYRLGRDRLMEQQREVARMLRQREDELVRERAQLFSRLRAAEAPKGESASDSGSPGRIPAPKTPAVETPGIPGDLIESIELNECVLFAGARVAASAGVPTLSQLLGEVVADQEHQTQTDLSTLRDELEAGEAERVAQVLASRFSSVELAKSLKRALNRSTLAPGPLVKSLTEIPFTGMVTDDWSKLVTREFSSRQPVMLTPWAMESARDTIREHRFFALHLYGDVDSEVLLSYDDYRRTLEQSREYALFLGALMATRSMLFIGASPSDIGEFCRGLNLNGPGSRCHYALVPQDQGVVLEGEVLERRYGVKLLPYVIGQGSSPVQEFIGVLSSRTGSKSGMKTSVRPPERLQRIRLRNIGPFESLDLEFDHSWNVLLGDNSVGKTTVLRAVALALAGDSPQTAVAPARLLRSGESSGFIELSFGRNTYRTMLTRERDQVWADAEQITPVQSGAWLAVGMPALRGVSRSDPRPLAALAQEGPSASDILPLLQDDVDGRLDDLKSWVATLWLLSNDGSSRTRYRAMLETFFSIVRRLTPGIDFDFQGVDPETGSLRLQTTDGEISIDDLSLGMSAMLGGIGVLLQRLYEVYPEDAEPQRRNALLLIDEIDAHLHPAWQSRLLPALRETFPGLQLLATTHSPLIVSNTASGELHHLRRDGDRIVPERIHEHFGGWRADQILTGPAFDLDTTMDRATAAKLEEYRQLQSAPPQTDFQWRRIEELASELDKTMPSPEETPTQREASRLLEEWLDWRLRDAPQDRRELLASQAMEDLRRLHGETGEGP